MRQKVLMKTVLRVCANCFQIKVEDFGTGFSTDALRHATEQFYTEKKERSEDHYGLGLYFADMVAKEHNGKLRVENKADGNGAEVTLIFEKNKCG